MTERQTAIEQVTVEGSGLPPIEEFTTPEAWLLALPRRTVVLLALDDGRTVRAAVERILDSVLLGEVVTRLRIQVRLAALR